MFLFHHVQGFDTTNTRMHAYARMLTTYCKFYKVYLAWQATCNGTPAKLRCEAGPDRNGQRSRDAHHNRTIHCILDQAPDEEQVLQVGIHGAWDIPAVWRWWCGAKMGSRGAE